MRDSPHLNGGFTLGELNLKLNWNWKWRILIGSWKKLRRKSWTWSYRVILLENNNRFTLHRTLLNPSFSILSITLRLNINRHKWRTQIVGWYRVKMQHHYNLATALISGFSCFPETCCNLPTFSWKTWNYK